SQTEASSPDGACGGRTKGVTAKPPGFRRRRRSNAAQTASSSGRSTWHDTTAYPATASIVRIFAANTRAAAALVAAAAILPRLVVLLAERGSILTAYTEKSDDFARTFVASGTYGFVAGHPSALTQPLYGFFLIPIYWIFGRSWESVGPAQVVVATLTALTVLAIGRR